MKTFEVIKLDMTEQGELMVTLKDVATLSIFQRVVCDIKVLKVNDSEEVSGGKVKQDILIGDTTGTLRLTVWEHHIGKLEEGNSYKLIGVNVQEFRGEKYLSTAKANCEVELIEDIGFVPNTPEEPHLFCGNQATEVRNL